MTKENMERFAQAGLRLRELQLKVASDVERCLTEPLPKTEEVETRQGKSIRKRSLCGLIEAGTGVGKTLGYLVPLLEYQQRTGKRVAISTFTRFQQRQVAADLEIARNRILKDYNGKVSIRLGRRNFVSPNRIAYWREKLPENTWPQEWRNFFRWVDSWTEDTDPLETTFMAWREISPEMPDIPGFGEENIALREDESHYWYEKHAQDAMEADVVITNHATILIHAALKTDVLGNIDTVVFDEADQLVTAAQSLLSRRVRPTILVAEAHRDYPESKEFDYKAAYPIAKRIQDTLRSIGENLDYRETALGELAKDFPEEVESIRKDLLLLKSLLPERDRRDIRRILDGLDSGGEGDVVYSPIRSIPAFHIETLDLGGFMGRMFSVWEDADLPFSRAILISATLSDPITKKLDFAGYQYGIFWRADVEARYEPDRFGEMRFVLPDPRVPGPFLKSREEVRLEEGWLDYIEKAIACDTGGRKLILSPAFADIEALLERRGEEKKTCLIDGVLYHQPDLSSQKLIHRVLHDDEVRAVITPSLWEGVNLRDASGKAWMEEVMITRIPTPPYSPVSQDRMVVWRLLLQAKRGGKTRTEAEIRNDILWDSAKKALRRLSQGIGRGIRDEKDSVRIWILDPRIELPLDWRGLLVEMPEGLEMLQASKHEFPFPAMEYWINAIPSRFRSAVLESALFERGGNIVEVLS